MASRCGNIFIAIVISSLTYQVICHSKRSIDLIAAHSLITDIRLPKEIAPTKYDLKIQPFPEEGYFTGEVRINITWHDKTDRFALHADSNLNITDIKIMQYESDDESNKALSYFEPKAIKITKIDTIPKKPLIIIRLAKSLKRGALCEAHVIFSGTMYNDTSEGMFRHRYIDTSTGESKWYIATHFRPNQARRVFPCFDEPAFKAKFKISIARQDSMTALSNMDLDNSEEIPEQPGWYWDHFQESPEMSTFTVGIVVSDFTFIERNTTEDNKELGTNIRVWSRPDYGETLQNVSDKIIKSLLVLEDFWGVRYPLSKLDCVALPNYQATRPADNWGLILFKESELSSKKSWHISQELVYQWLGAFVTPYWWSDAHINNALNRYITAYTTLKLNYGYETFNNWPMTMLYSIYYEFSKRYPHGKSTAIKQDSISTKTELVFRMLNYTLGESTFNHGLQRFMTDRTYKTFFGDDIWRSLDEQAHFDEVLPEDVTVNAIAASWITKDRLPVVSVIRDYEDKTANVTQKVYLRERPHDVPDQDKFLWWIPITMIKQNKLNFRNTTPVVWMQKERSVTLTDMPESDQFIIVNPEEIGPFPVNYDTENWKMLAKFLQDNESSVKIPVNTRAKLLHDAWNLAYAGDLSFDTALDMTLFLKHEREYIAWDPIFTMIDHIGRHIDNSKVHKKFQAYIRHLLTPLYLELGTEPQEGESDGMAHLRSSSKTFLCQAGYDACIREAQAAYKKWMNSENPDEGNPVANQYICPVFEWGTMEEWEFGLQRIIHFPSFRKQSERTYLLKTLAGCPIDPLKIERLLNITVLEENGNFTDNDIYLIFSKLTGGASGYTTLFKFVEKHWYTIKEKFENRPHLWNSLITSATTVFKTQEGLDLVSGLYGSRKGKFGTAEFIIERALKNIKEESEWSDENLPDIELWLDNYIKDNEIDIENK